jgi:hypothetical protein
VTPSEFAWTMVNFGALGPSDRVRFRSLPDILPCLRDVRFIPERSVERSKMRKLAGVTENNL